MRSMSSSTFHASAGGSGTSNELSNSIELPAISDHVGGAEPLPDPVRAGKEPPVIVALRDQLDADRQFIRAAVGRHGQSGDMQDRPHRLEARVAGITETARRFAIHARRKQHFDILEYGGQSGPAGFAEPQRRDV